MSPTDANREDLVLVADLGVPVDDRGGADPAVLSYPDVSPMTACGPITYPPRSGHRGGRIANGYRRARRSCAAGPSSGSRPRAAPPRPRRRRRCRQTAWARASVERRGPSVTSRRRRSPGTTLPAELRVVHAAEVHPALRYAVGLVDEEHRRDPGRGSRSSTPRAAAACLENAPGSSSSLTVTFLTATIRFPGS